MPKVRFPELVTVDEPKSIVLVLDPDDATVPQVRLYVSQSKDPLFMVRFEAPKLNASASAHSAPTPLTVMAGSATPLVVIVLPTPVPERVIPPV